MTSTPVKDVGALMNYVGNRATISTGIGAESTGGFGDVMNKASGDRQSVSSVKADDVKDAARRETRVDKSHNRPKTTGTENGKAKLKETDADVQKAAEEAGSQLVKDIAEEFSVSEEDVLNAMEELGLSLASLLDAGNLTQLVLAVSGQDSLALLTDGGLYDSLQMLLQNQQELIHHQLILKYLLMNH